jgi:hypothetical protein
MSAAQITKLERARDKAADALGAAQRELDVALAAAGQAEWVRERAIREHEERVRLWAVQKRADEYPRWDYAERDGGTVTVNPETHKCFCTVLDSMLDRAEDALRDQQPEGFKPVARQGPASGTLMGSPLVLA